MRKINILSFEVELSASAQAALNEGLSWSGKLEVTIKGDRRLREIKQEVRKTRARKRNLHLEELAVIDYWNNSPVVAKGTESHRNMPVSLSPNPGDLSTLRACLKRFSPEGIERFLDAYFACCERGEHFHRSRNVAYKDLFGFLRKLNDAKTGRDRAWWMPTDIDPGESAKLTDTPEVKEILAFANAYAKEFMESAKYPVEIKARDYDAFRRANITIENMVKKFPINRKQAISLMFKCARETFSKTIYPCNIGNVKFLYVALIQYLKGIYD